MVWTPLNLTALDAWWDPSDFTTMWQDSGKTTPVTAAGQPVGYISDKSGNGRDLLQATNAVRPILRRDANGFWYIEFVAASRYRFDQAVTFGTIHQGVSLFFCGAATQAVSNGSGGVLVALNNPTVEFGHSVEGLTTGWTDLGRRLNTDSYNAIAVGANDFTLQSVIGVYDYANATASVYKNNTSVASGAFETPGLSDTIGTVTLSIADSPGFNFAFDGKLYQLVLGHALSATERSSLNTFLQATFGISSGPVFSNFDSSPVLPSLRSPTYSEGFVRAVAQFFPPPPPPVFSDWMPAQANFAVRNSPQVGFAQLPAPPVLAITPTNIFFSEWPISVAMARPPRDFSSFIKQQAPPVAPPWGGFGDWSVARLALARIEGFQGFVSTTGIAFTPSPMAAFSGWVSSPVPLKSPVDFSGFVPIPQPVLTPGPMSGYAPWSSSPVASRVQADFSGFVFTPAAPAPTPTAQFETWGSAKGALKNQVDFSGFVSTTAIPFTPSPMAAFSAWSAPSPLIRAAGDFSGFVRTPVAAVPTPTATFEPWRSATLPTRAAADFSGFVAAPTPVTMGAFSPWAPSAASLRAPTDFGGYVSTAAIPFTPAPMVAYGQWVASPVPLKSPSDFGGFITLPPVAKAPLFQYQPWETAPFTQAVRQSAMVPFGWPPHAVFPPPPPPPPGGSSGEWEIIKTTIPEPTRSWEFTPLPWISPPAVLVEVDAVRRPKHKLVKRAGPKPDYSIYNRPSPVKEQAAAPVSDEPEALTDASEPVVADRATPSATVEPKKERTPSLLLPMSDLGAVSGETLKPKKSAPLLVPAFPVLPAKKEVVEEKPKVVEAEAPSETAEEKVEEPKEEEKKPTFNDDADIEIINKYLSDLHEKQLHEYRNILKEILDDTKEIEKILGIAG